MAVAGRSSPPWGFSREGAGLEGPGLHLRQVSLPGLTSISSSSGCPWRGPGTPLCLQHLLWAAAGRVFNQKLAVQIQKPLPHLNFRSK